LREADSGGGETNCGGRHSVVGLVEWVLAAGGFIAHGRVVLRRRGFNDADFGDARVNGKANGKVTKNVKAPSRFR